MSDIYVIVAQNDKPHIIGGKDFIDDGGPLVFEQYTSTATLENMKKRAAELSTKYGECRIARLEFIDE